MSPIVFGILAALLVLSALGVVLARSPIRSALSLVVTLFLLAVTFLFLDAHLLAALQMIVYAGAIMVLFVFVVMMLNLGEETVAQEKQWLKPGAWAMPALLSAVLLVQWLLVLPESAAAGAQTVDARQVGITLYGPYLLIVELVSMLLLAAMVTAWHIGRREPTE